MANIKDNRTHIEVRHENNQQLNKDLLVEVEETHEDDHDRSISECHECNEHIEITQEFLEES